MEKKNIKKIDLAIEVSKGTGLSLVDSSEIVDLFFNILSNGIALEKEVKIMTRPYLGDPKYKFEKYS